MKQWYAMCLSLNIGIFLHQTCVSMESFDLAKRVHLRSVIIDPTIWNRDNPIDTVEIEQVTFKNSFTTVLTERTVNHHEPSAGSQIVHLKLRKKEDDQPSVIFSYKTYYQGEDSLPSAALAWVFDLILSQPEPEEFKVITQKTYI